MGHGPPFLFTLVIPDPKVCRAGFGIAAASVVHICGTPGYAAR